jgi:amino acid transporter
MSPFGVFSLYGFTGPMSGGHLATAYVAATAAIVLTALSYGKMARIHPSAGSAYSYTQKTVGPLPGFFVGWAILLDYFLLPLLCVSLAANYVKGQIFPDVPMIIIVLACAAVMTVVNVLGVRVTTSFSILLLAFQLLVVAIFLVLCVLVITQQGGVGALADPRPFVTADLSLSATAAAAALICNTFLGFDAVTTLSEETRNPRVVIPRALVVVSLGAGVLFTAIAYFAFLAYPSYEFQNPASASVELSEAIGGAFFGALFLAGCIISSLASAVVTQASASRILYAMGRDGVLPRRGFGYIHPRFRAPLFNTILIGAVSLIAGFVTVDSIAAVVNFGAFTAFASANVCVIVHYLGKERRRTSRDIFTYGLLPLLGVAVIAYLWTQLDANSNVLGLIWLGIGTVYIAVLTRGFRRPVPHLSFSDSDDSAVINARDMATARDR